MHVGCCENCRYIDLVEDHPDGCPRCKGKLVSLCVDSTHWNSMNSAGRRLLIMNILTEPKLRPLSMPEFELDPDEKKEVITELVKKADERDVQVREATDAVHGARQVEHSVKKDQQELISAVIKEKLATQEFAFVCSKCNRVIGHVRRNEKYYCNDCGAEMLDSGYRTNIWISLSKEEKRKIISETQLQHIVKAISENPDR